MKRPIHETVARGVKIACVKRETTVEAAATESGVSKSSIYRYMKGETDMFVSTLGKFCEKGLGMRLDQVMSLGK